jgi:phage shock protein A
VELGSTSNEEPLDQQFIKQNRLLRSQVTDLSNKVTELQGKVEQVKKMHEGCEPKIIHLERTNARLEDDILKISSGVETTVTDAILPIMTAQRDRFRKRCEELEQVKINDYRLNVAYIFFTTNSSTWQI